MYYASRIELGQKLATRIGHLKGHEPVVLCLRDEALTSCIGLAAKIHAWIYPLITEPIRLPGDPRVLGVINPDGLFCWSPVIPPSEQDGILAEFHGPIEDAKREAFSRVNARLGEWGDLKKDALKGRVVLISGDVVRDQNEIAAAHAFLKEIDTQQVIGLAGNIEALAADNLHQKADHSEFLDVMTNMFDEAHYFEQADAYTPNESRQLALNISQYWA